ncbi:MAG: ZIP family metal transporter [Clostridia bacterium]|nr:ZIP family metal transporter [Clostridia bacterium]
MIMTAAWGILIPFLGTALGAAWVFFMKKAMRPGLQQALNGLAAGIMVAASFFSLLLPALDQAGIAPTVIGFLAGMLLLHGIDGALTRIKRRDRHLSKTEKLLLAVTLHNVPEGMAVGVAYAGWLFGRQDVTLTAAFALALGIALQNIPEGAIVSMPLRAEGMPTGRAFWCGVLSGAVEPVGAVLILAAAGVFAPVLPWLLAFAAGAMFSVVVEELIPEMEEQGAKNWGSLCFALGFVVMMALDVALG